MEKESSHLYIITGGPGAGKTTLLEALHKNGYVTAPEEGRRIIREQLQMNGEGVPWKNRILFAELMFDASVKTYQKIRNKKGVKTAFFDRGILDTIGYLRTENIPVPEEMKTRALKMTYQKKVFILPPWNEIYENDPERKQSPEQAVHTFNCIRETYLEYGYQIIEVPRDTVEQRVRFILMMTGNG
ncbi:AAA family ATPase [Chryseobacterium flavum]|uniref:AAA family ATPase n=1 Tax=Chryseobacterium flavum TaxID=415851 RepID=UPI002FD916F6